MKMKFAILLAIVFTSFSLSGQVKIGDEPQTIHPASLLELESNDKVLVITRVNNEDMANITPERGALVYNNEERCVFYYDGTVWVNMCSGLGANNFTFSTNPEINDEETIVITQIGDNYNFELKQITGANIAEETINGFTSIQNGSITASKLTESVAGSGLGIINNIDPGEMFVNVDDTSIEIVSDTLQVKIGGITLDKLATEVTDAFSQGQNLGVGQILIGNDTGTIASDTNAIPFTNFGDANRDLSMNSNRITDLGDPVNQGDAVNLLSMQNAINAAITGGGGTGGGGTADGYISNVQLNNNFIEFTGIGNGFNNSVNLNSIDNQNAQEVPLFEAFDFDEDGTDEDNVENALLALKGAIDAGGTGGTADGNDYATGGTLVTATKQVTLSGTVAYPGGALDMTGMALLTDIPAADDASIELTGNQLQVKNAGITADKLAQMGATNGQVLKWDTALSTWVPGNDNNDGSGASIAAGNGLELDGTDNEFDVSVDGTSIVINGTDQLQLGTMGANTNGQVLQWDNDAGTWNAATASSTDLSKSDLMQTAGEDRTYDLNGQNLIFDNITNTGGKFVIGSVATPASMLDVEGQIQTRSGFAASPGTAGEPSYGFYTDGDADTGMYRAGPDQIGFSVGGNNALLISEPVAGTTKVAVTDNLELDGNLIDEDNLVGNEGQILSSTATGVRWIDSSTQLKHDDGSTAIQEGAIFIADASGLPTYAQNPNNDTGKVFFWDPDGREVSSSFKYGALYIGIDNSDLNKTQSKAVKVQIAEQDNNGLVYPLMIHNKTNSNGTGASVGMLFTVESQNPKGKGALVYERKGGYGVGDFHFLQNTNNTAAENPDLGDEVMTIKNNGKVGIGTTNPNVNSLLHVTGNVYSDGSFYSTDTAIQTPDYVFEKYFEGETNLDPSYKFWNLKDIETFIKQKHHLPGIKSAKEIITEGKRDLTETSVKNLEKIEELFLHTIEQQQQIETLKEENKSLSTELNELKKEVELIKQLLTKEN